MFFFLCLKILAMRRLRLNNFALDKFSLRFTAKPQYVESQKKASAYVGHNQFFFILGILLKKEKL